MKIVLVVISLFFSVSIFSQDIENQLKEITEKIQAANCMGKTSINANNLWPEVIIILTERGYRVTYLYTSTYMEPVPKQRYDIRWDQKQTYTAAVAKQVADSNNISYQLAILNIKGASKMGKYRCWEYDLTKEAMYLLENRGFKIISMGYDPNWKAQKYEISW